MIKLNGFERIILESILEYEIKKINTQVQISIVSSILCTLDVV